MKTRRLHGLLIAAVVGSTAPAAGAQPVAALGRPVSGDESVQEAFAAFRRELARAPERGDLWVLLADLEASQGNLAAAVEALEQAGRMTLSDPSVYARHVPAFGPASGPRAALEAIEQALTADPENATYLQARGTAATWTGAFDRAQDSYRRLLRLRPDDATSALKLARVNAWSGEVGEGCAMYRVYLAAHPEDSAVWIELARSESWTGRVAAALEVLASYRALFGNTPEYRAELAAALARAGGSRLAVNSPVDPTPEDTRAVGSTVGATRADRFGAFVRPWSHSHPGRVGSSRSTGRIL